jgi:hypothetical protein
MKARSVKSWYDSGTRLKAPSVKKVADEIKNFPNMKTSASKRVVKKSKTSRDAVVFADSTLSAFKAIADAGVNVGSKAMNAIAEKSKEEELGRKGLSLLKFAALQTERLLKEEALKRDVRRLTDEQMEALIFAKLADGTPLIADDIAAALGKAKVVALQPALPAAGETETDEASAPKAR